VCLGGEFSQLLGLQASDWLGSHSTNHMSFLEVESHEVANKLQFHGDSTTQAMKKLTAPHLQGCCIHETFALAPCLSLVADTPFPMP